MNTKQKKKSLKERVLTLLKEHKKEEELTLSILTTSKKVVSSGIKIASTNQPANSDSLSAASLGFSIFGIGLSFAAFFHAVYDFLKGDSFSLTRFGKILSLGALIILAVIGLAIPTLGEAMAVAAAAIGLVMASYQLARHVYEKVTNTRKVSEFKTELDELNQDTAEDGEKLNYILSKSEGTLKPAEEQEFINALKEIEPRQAAREKRYKEIQPLFEKALIKDAKLRHSTTIERCLTVIASLLGVFAAILFFDNPFIAGILAAVATLTCVALTARATYTYLSEKRLAAKNKPSLSSQLASLIIKQNVPEPTDKRDETKEANAELNQVSDKPLSPNIEEPVYETKSQRSFFSTMAPTSHPLDTSLSRQVEASDNTKAQLKERENTNDQSLPHSH